MVLPPMALRATSRPAPATRSATAGQRVEFAAKVENTGATPEEVALRVEGLHQRALRTPLDHAFAFEPASATVPAKARKAVSFAWTATLPEGKEAFTFRGKLVLRRVADGKLVAEAPLDLYVAR